MPSHRGKSRHAKLGPRFSEAAKAANNQNCSSSLCPEEILGHPQYYLGGPAGVEENRTLPALPHVYTAAPRPTAQPFAPVPKPAYLSSISPSPPMSNRMPVEFPPSLTPPPGVFHQFPPFHLILPPLPPRTISPPFEHPSTLLNPETVPTQVAPWTKAREPSRVFQPAPCRPINLASMHANLSRSSRSSVAAHESAVGLATENADNVPLGQPDESPYAFPVTARGHQTQRWALYGINWPRNHDIRRLVTSCPSIQALSRIDGSINADLLCGKIQGPGFNRPVKAMFSCTADQGWVDDIIKSDYWLTDIRDNGVWRVPHPRYWRFEVHAWIGSISGVMLWAKLRYAIDKDPFLNDGGKCAPSFIWIVLLMRRVLMSLPYAQELGFLNQFGQREFDPCDTAFSLHTLSRVVLDLMDTITLKWWSANLRKPYFKQQKVFSTCHNGHSNVPTLGSDSLVPEGVEFINDFKKCFMQVLEEIDTDCLTSLVVARCTHPPGFFSNFT